MKNLLFLLPVMAGLLLCMGCPKPAEPPVSFKLDRPFPLKIGQTGALADSQAFTIRFDKIASDSRCPIGETCITAGKADVVLTLSKAGNSKTLTLPYILPNGTENVVDFQGHTVRILGVSPFRVKDVELKPETYAVTLNVSITPPPPPKAQANKDFKLDMGQTIFLEDDPASSIRFDSVSGDSRCAQDVKCIWAGRADCVFSLTSGAQTQKVTLATGDLGKGGSGETPFGPYTLKIKAIAPAKMQGQAIKQEQYKVMLTLVK